ncbi:MAG: PRD domain-containing protein [Aerococcus sp.]|nr:PRD domain-containing protein [Aerococcus sp.]
MQVERVLNNNAVQSTLDTGEQVIVTGPGVGFQMKKQDHIDDTKVEKVFVLKQDDQRIEELLQMIPDDILAVTAEIITKAEQKLNQTYQDSLFLGLADHIHFAITRSEQGINIHNPLAWDIKRLYPNVFSFSQRAVAIIGDALHVTLPEEEVASIAIHLINGAKEGMQLNETMHMLGIVRDLLHLIELKIGHPLDMESLSYSRLQTHLQYFAQRIYHNDHYPTRDDTFLYEQVQKNYPEAFAISDSLAQYVKNRYDYHVHPEEQVYLTIHIQRLLEG